MYWYTCKLQLINLGLNHNYQSIYQVLYVKQDSFVQRKSLKFMNRSSKTNNQLRQLKALQTLPLQHLASGQDQSSVDSLFYYNANFIIDCFSRKLQLINLSLCTTHLLYLRFNFLVSKRYFAASVLLQVMFKHNVSYLKLQLKREVIEII